MPKISDHGVYNGRHQYAFWCPGCDIAHGFQVPDWTFNGDLNSPTVGGSVKVLSAKPACHSYIENGKIRFLADCDHALAGKTVDLPDFDEALHRWGAKDD